MSICRKVLSWGRSIYSSSIVREFHSTANFTLMRANKIMTTSQFPTTIQGFGYAFNQEGQLRKIISDTEEPGTEPFEFNVSTDHSFNQKRYEALGEVITEHVYSLLEADDIGLERLQVPKDADQSGSSFIFASKDALTNEKLMILIHGSGVVRAGQWARSLIINDSLQSGTQIPYIKRAMKMGFGVLVLNTNDNKRCKSGTPVPIVGSSNPLEHASTVWEEYIKQAKAKYITIVAHSFGGLVTVQLVNQFYEDFVKKVFAIALTDSVHHLVPKEEKTDVNLYLRKAACNWVSSSDPLDQPINDKRNIIPEVSAGHPKHEMTSWSCIDSVFKFIETGLQEAKTSS